MNSVRVRNLICLFLGLAAYYVFVRVTGTGFPCLFRTFFHLQCPGCGGTHLILALSQGDFHGAFASHPVLFVFLPFLVWLLGRSAWAYIHERTVRWRRWEQAGIWMFLTALTVFAVWRNIRLIIRLNI